jgi:Immunity protein 72/Immunity protein 71
MMNEADRKKVFWLLKKYSSYTAWQALRDAYAEFVTAWEYAMANAKEVDVDNQNIGWTKKILDGQIAFEKGLPLLREGQRSVFRSTSTGYLKQAAGAIVFINRIMDPDEFVFDWMVNKDDVVTATNNLRIKRCGLFAANEPNNPPGFKTGWSQKQDPLFGPFNIPSHLSDVPTPTDTTANTGEALPITGIWEPEWEISPGLFKSLTGTPAKVEKGCMNYLLAGTIAPQYKDGELDPEINVTWRLIWADHRYEDGIIPEEEKEYLAEAAPEAPRPPTGRLRAEPNDLVPKTGWWHSTAKPNGQYLHYFEAGQRFPDWHTTHYGSVIWGFDPDEQKEPPRK